MGDSNERPRGPDADFAPRCPRYYTLDAWRGIACLLVVVLHSTALLRRGPTGNATVDMLLQIVERFWMGVPMFFVISGYCISAAADGVRQRSGGIGNYFYRRLRRIYPPYWVFLLLASVLVGVVAGHPTVDIADGRNIVHPSALTAVQWFGNVTLTENWLGPIVAVSHLPRFVMGHAWTLCYEEQFYAVTGLLLWLSPTRLFLASTITTVASLVAYAVLPKLGFPLYGFFFDGSWIAFALGVWVYDLRNYPGHRAWILSAVIPAMAAAFIARHPLKVFRNASHSYSMESFLACALVFALVLIVVSRFDTRLASVRVLRPLTWCGLLCYSMYLVHLPVVSLVSRLLYGNWTEAMTTSMLLLTIAAGVAATVPVAWLFHVTVERRWMNAR